MRRMRKWLETDSLLSQAWHYEESYPLCRSRYTATTPTTAIRIDYCNAAKGELVRAPALQAGGPRFESVIAYHDAATDVFPSWSEGRQ